MGLMISQRKAVTKVAATQNRSASLVGEVTILDELCELTGWHHDHAGKALREALGSRRAPGRQRPPGRMAKM